MESLVPIICASLALLRGQNKLPTFNNLSCLELGLDRYTYWEEDLPKLLHSSPILENLVFPEGIVFSESDDEFCDINFWTKLQISPSCLSSHLKTITIGLFRGLDEELRIIKYLLGTGKVLTKLIVYCNVRSKKEYRGLMKLCRIGRLATNECLLEIRRY
ncbi:hypothetical protein BVRB_4g091640 [Beta vulgaris subsp. vulgaris]|nr:hypothetical protein BVRB_4g091640 [Beta vulgaris subsp. vulgaris]